MTVVTDARALDLGTFLRPGDRIVWGQACGEPTTLVEKLIAQVDRIGSLEAFAASSFSGLLDAAAASLKLSSMGAIGALRTVAAAGRLNIVPCHVGQIATLIEQGIIGCDVAFVQVSPPDANGDHSFGLINDFVQAAVARARVVIAEVNDRVPFTYGDAMLSAEQIDCAVHVSRRPVEVAPAPIGDTDLAIAKTIAGYVDDGSVLQIGIGAVPDAVMQLLRDRRDLGVHSGMIGDGLVELVEAGAITNARKSLDPGVSITGALVGTARLYDFAHRNSQLALRNSAYTHGDAILMRLTRLVTINSALEVDLTGQVNAEQSGEVYLGGTGGQVDYVRAGSRSEGGRSIVALPAMAKGGTVSRIVASLSGPITTARSEVDVIVTEFGAAELKGRSLAERTRRLIAIAHPNFREGLDRAAHLIQRRGF